MTSLGWVESGESLSRNKDFVPLTRNAALKSRLKRGVVAAANALRQVMRTWFTDYLPTLFTIQVKTRH